MMTPIKDEILKFINSNKSRLFMPGHKGKLDGIFSNVAPYDMTEITNLDSLYQSDGVILKLEEHIKNIYGSKKTLISTCGSTLAIQTMLSLILKENDEIIIARNVHLSAVNTLALLGAKPVFISPKFCHDTALPLPVSAVDVENTLKNHPKAKAIYITSPDYYGSICDVSAISKVARRYNVYLICDNAHGAHLPFLKGYHHPITQGADCTADSLHKTLPSLTGSALLHIANEKLMEDAKVKMSVFGTTSPSYLIMLSIEQLFCDIEKIDFSNVVYEVEKLKKTAINQGFRVNPFFSDPTKLTIEFSQFFKDAQEAKTHFAKYSIEPEFTSDRHMVFMFSYHNLKKDYDNMRLAILNASKKYDFKEVMEFIMPLKDLELRQAFFAPQEFISVEDCEGKTAACLYCPCPPGVPIVMPGEKINENTKKFLKKASFFSIKVVK